MKTDSSSRLKNKKVMKLLAEVTGGKSYKAHKYGLDHTPFLLFMYLTNA